ncbi:hypothetical protein H0H92_008425 [Tricholoma furcatifolium]|nr:hypothetical protein H0H92_008425 [Tricholoma furcatifolium]
MPDGIPTQQNNPFQDAVNAISACPLSALTTVMTSTDSSESKTLRLRLVALLSLYDLLPPSFDKAAFLDFNSPPPLDATVIDRDTTIQSLLAIAQRLQSQRPQFQQISCSGKD